MHHRIGAQRNNVFLGQRLDAVGHGLQQSRTAPRGSGQAVLHARPAPCAPAARRWQTAPGKTQMMATTPSSTPASGCQPAGRNPTSQCLRRTKIWSSLFDHRLSSPLLSGFGCGLPQACRCSSLGRGGFGRGLGLGFGLGLFLGQPRIHFGRFGGMNLVVVLVRLGQLLAVVAAGRRSGPSVLSSNSVSILIASNGQTSTQIWQLMQTEISMSKRAG